MVSNMHTLTILYYEPQPPRRRDYTEHPRVGGELRSAARGGRKDGSRGSPVAGAARGACALSLSLPSSLCPPRGESLSAAQPRRRIACVGGKGGAARGSWVKRIATSTVWHWPPNILFTPPTVLLQAATDDGMTVGCDDSRIGNSDIRPGVNQFQVGRRSGECDTQPTGS